MGHIITISGRSGVGKSSLAKSLVENLGASLVQSFTTRKAREGDLPGEYHYLPEEDRWFIDGVKTDYLWIKERNSELYATPKRFITGALTSKVGCAVMILTPDVIELLRKYVVTTRAGLKSLIHLYLESPSEMELAARMRGRGDTQDEIEARLALEREWDQEAHESEGLFRFLSAGSPDATYNTAILMCLRAMFN